jgi:hypothetical protein
MVYVPGLDGLEAAIKACSAVHAPDLYPQKDRLRYPCPTKDNTARIRKTTKRIFAPSQEKFATPAKPRKPAIRAMTRNTIAKRNMVRFSFNKAGLRWRIANQARDYHFHSAALFRAAGTRGRRTQWHRVQTASFSPSRASCQPLPGDQGSDPSFRAALPSRVSANTSRTENCAHADICQYIPNSAINPGTRGWGADSPLPGSEADWSALSVGGCRSGSYPCPGPRHSGPSGWATPGRGARSAPAGPPR